MITLCSPLVVSPPAEHPELQRIRRELSLLSKLYSLHSSVTDSVAGYYDVLWADLNIEKINAELQDFQNRCTLVKTSLFFLYDSLTVCGEL